MAGPGAATKISSLWRLSKWPVRRGTFITFAFALCRAAHARITGKGISVNISFTSVHFNCSHSMRLPVDNLIAGLGPPQRAQSPRTPPIPASISLFGKFFLNIPLVFIIDEDEPHLTTFYQELETIFSLAPPIPSSTTPASDTDDTHRKAIEGDCPICFMPFEPETEETVWCKTACGNNIHKTCFEQWARSQKSSGGGIAVRCVYWFVSIPMIFSIKNNHDAIFAALPPSPLQKYLIS